MYKVSQFNVPFKKDNINFLYNSHTGAFVKISDEYKDTIKKISKRDYNEIPNLHLEELTRAGFIVETSLDEYGVYHYLTNKSRFGSEYLGLTIATTLQCNFRCPYCYENHVDEYIEGQKEEDLKKFIQNNLRNKTEFSVTWYGGEPLLKKDLIDRMSKYILTICKEKNIQFRAKMVSNGYLLNRKIAEHLVQENNVKYVQITLDGGPETHDVTRILRNKQGSFNKILNNIKEIQDIIQVGIRVNVSKENVADVYKLFPILMNQGLNNKVSVYFAPVGAYNDVCQSISESCLVTREFAKWETDLIEYADKIGFNMGNLYPKNRGGWVCQAVDNNSFVVDAYGDLFKCWHEVGNKKLRVGNLAEGITSLQTLTKWMNWELPNKCKTCHIMPLCKGRCPELSLEKQDFECDQLKYNIKDRLYRYYIKNPIDKQKVPESEVIKQSS
ncbi:MULTISPECIES: radical SAM/SPASM domain-containing protein [Bacillus cereus group]|uniref:radical SAM/SPASM domain-containing protein n=1 Tax=Bacillus cereus group TaxID=86661 RepID=UPI0007B6E2CE|nr:radical SAM protein [Bacillus cereus]ANC11067.1 radical SAM protein [Bacillus cereus]ANC17169.1 radical SAM protein [Bacillus cereus]MDA1997239.1 radical SAM protein [Bacillus cereus]MDA2003086.1 radical SAM protein [Bacillus cereus]MDA3654555.1 radical SAM protein [Bacillus cereus]